jgi:NAD(P)H-dependent FMN reductase
VGSEGPSSWIGIAGSLREGSLNRALLRAAAERTPGGVTLEVATLGGIPLYDGDRESREGVPEPARALQDRLAAADALVLATPEYNHGMPGVLKNAVDWLSRPPREIPRVFGDLPVAIVGATPGGGGTALAQSACLPTLRVLGTRPWFGGSLQVARAHERLAGGVLADDDLAERVARFTEGFAEFVARCPRRRG